MQETRKFETNLRLDKHVSEEGPFAKGAVGTVGKPSLWQPDQSRVQASTMSLALPPNRWGIQCCWCNSNASVSRHIMNFKLNRTVCFPLGCLCSWKGFVNFRSNSMICFCGRLSDNSLWTYLRYIYIYVQIITIWVLKLPTDTRMIILLVLLWRHALLYNNLNLINLDLPVKVMLVSTAMQHLDCLQ